MPANSPALFPSLAGGINNITGEDDDFGDFVFSSPPSSSHTPSFFFPYPTPTVLSTNDEDWGDFVAGQLGSNSLQLQSSSLSSPPSDPSPPSSKAWEKPNGAIPLSVFGEEEAEEADPVTIENGFGSYSLSIVSSPRPATAGKLNDLIERLYGQEEEEDFDEGSWEFKDALPADARPKMEMDEGGGAVFGFEMVADANENGRSQVVVNRLENGWKGIEHFNMDGQERGPVDVFSAHEKLTNRSLGHNNSVTDKALHEMLPNFGNGTSSSGQNGFKIEFPENAIINGFTEKIQDDQAEILPPPEKQEETYGNMQEMIASEDACTGRKTASRINQLLNVSRTSNFKTVEQECHLSERLLAAEKHLNAAVDLFEHSSLVLQILSLASREQQLFYINAWSKLASACSEELQLGAKIWTESLDGNISKQILNKGNKYFLALGEVYRVSKILKATVRFYMPWLLSNLEDSNEIVTCLEKVNEAWINSRLEQALQSISSNMDLDDKGLAKPLLESIKLIDKVNEPTFQDTAFQHNNGFCRFSLLPLDKLPGIKTVVWNGDCYIAKIANFWANRISPDPPELPSIMHS